MYKTYLKIAFRSIWKSKTFSLINVIGLSIGLSAAFVIGIMIYYDLTFDNFHADKNRIYRVVVDTQTPEQEGHSRGVPVPLVDALQATSTSIDHVSPFFLTYFGKVNNEATKEEFTYISDVVFADQEYFQIFSYRWLAGASKTALKSPYEVVLTKSRAEKYFPNELPEEILGKTLVYDDSLMVKITGIVADFEQRSDFTFKEFISRKSVQNSQKYSYLYDDSWGSVSSSTQLFIKADKFNNIKSIQDQLDALAKEHQDEKMTAMGYIRTFNLQPLKALHLNEYYGVFDSTGYRASASILIGLGIIALFLLLLGCINFINLNTAQSAKRAKEIGIRKTLGSSKRQLLFQYLSETFLLTLTAAMVSVLLSAWLLRVFADYIPSGISFDLFKNPVVILGILLLLLVITFLSGFYPALVLSQFKPVAVLKNQTVLGGDNRSLRKYLTVFQFVIAQAFIIATLLVGKQINYLVNKDMGFKTEAIAYLRSPYGSGANEKNDAFKASIEAIPEINAISIAGEPPASNSYSGRGVSYFAGGNEMHIQLQLLFGDAHYLNLYDIDLLAGRLPLSDSINEYVINETLMKQMGFQNPEKVLGQQFKSSDVTISIVGVMEDFNQQSLKEEIEPMAFVQSAQNNTIHFSFQANDIKNWPQVIEKIEANWKGFYPESTFQIHFVDDVVKKFYSQEQRTATLLKWATALAIIISCLGLFGLVIHTTERRTKEIGIRKVLAIGRNCLCHCCANFLLGN